MKILSQDINKVIMSRAEVFVIYHCFVCFQRIVVRVLRLATRGNCKHVPKGGVVFLRLDTGTVDRCFVLAIRIHKPFNDAFCCFDFALLIMRIMRERNEE